MLDPRRSNSPGCWTLGALTHQGVGLDDLVLGVLGVDLNADVVLATTSQTHQLQAVGGAGELLAVAHAIQENLKACHVLNCFPIHAMCLVLVATTHAASENRTTHLVSLGLD